jgi:hypothetical protein
VWADGGAGVGVDGGGWEMRDEVVVKMAPRDAGMCMLAMQV